MNYFSGDNQLLIRSMMETDIEKFVEAFAQQQWHKPYELFHSYYIEQKNKTRTVVVAEVNHQPAGYVTLLDKAVEGPFSGKNIPEIVDFNVLMKYQNRGIGSKLMDVTEGLAQAQSNFVSLAVGLHSGYGSAQRMY
ncbi:GNAT family N-acetyltransferase [Gracilibacillus alcaliphilus]|uniref:GNAT family N-acetyltransferase n=1 Tax=Gracilibacillus alcaliphilus TaxID=1401441 RepID=UPI0019583180|nr:GNAT family N-acetyltransferase [Gracilibacillus alcaliphilus]MBM7675303.1 putative acetyltransferase [Gracilibacillus alcaliphilus]